MTPEEQKEMVRSWLKREAERVCDLIDKGEIPEGWDGHEFRTYLAWRIAPAPNMRMTGKRLREYRRLIQINHDL